MTADKVALAQHVENDEIKLEALQVRASRTDGSSTRGLISDAYRVLADMRLLLTDSE